MSSEDLEEEGLEGCILAKCDPERRAVQGGYSHVLMAELGHDCSSGRQL